MQYYSEGLAKTNTETQRLAQTILNKWFRAIYRIEQEYLDKNDENYDEAYRKYHSKLKSLRIKEDVNVEGESDEDDKSRRGKGARKGRGRDGSDDESGSKSSSLSKASSLNQSSKRNKELASNFLG